MLTFAIGVGSQSSAPQHLRSSRGRVCCSSNADVQVVEVSVVRINPRLWQAIGSTDASVFQCVSGWVVNGSEERDRKVLCLGVAPNAARGKVARGVPGTSLLTVPPNVDFRQATVLPFYLLRASILIERLKSFFREETLRDVQVVVIGGSTRSFLVSSLVEEGASVTVVSTRGSSFSDSGRDAVKYLDPRVDSFAAKLDTIDVIVDTLGNEQSPQPAGELTELDLNGHPNCQYISVASPALLRVVEKGLLQAGAALYETMAGQLGKGDNLWVPSAEGARVLQAKLTALASNRNVRGAFPEKVLGMDDVYEAIRFPRDADTGARYGFDRPLPAAEVAPKPVAEPVPGEGWEAEETVPETVTDSSAVVAIHSLDQLKELVVDSSFRLVVLFVSAPWCRRCKFIRPKFEAAAGQVGQDTALLTLDAGGHEDVAMALGVGTVPAFLSYRNGKRSLVQIDATSGEALLNSIVAAM